MTQQLLARGDRVVGTVRKKDMLLDLKQRYGANFHAALLDLDDVTSIQIAVGKAFEEMGRIDVVVSNAGYGLFGAAEELTNDQIDQQIATNLTGSIQLIRTVLPRFRHQGRGRIIQISSEGGQIAYPCFSLYHATKWGIEGFVESVAQEVASFGIDFIIVEPGPTGTNFGAGLVRATPMDVYENTPAGAVRCAISDGSFVLKGDAARTVTAIISAADSAKPSLRLALGSTAYNSISTALAARLEAIQGQQQIARSADRQNL
ncbi:SDR family oxidoreductase [Phyllobacterium sp. CCNWLW109]|uniref:SDR family oxidoreductase n=1 Tax=Phyllobacterium sp. CCNWLW109 TaxID=3127479 RepID=UPI003FCD5303